MNHGRSLVRCGVLEYVRNFAYGVDGASMKCSWNSIVSAGGSTRLVEIMG